MSRIHLLPPELANQIAAGEVVERPASVVKELIENAIDAGATRVVVEIEMGGKRLIRVEDDGVGMDPDDAERALQRHATSKIARADDLAAIRTLGFRGEALPSIASVSHFVLRTRARGTPIGTEIRVNAGVVASIRQVGAPEGTSIEVADLFYNLPARRKFLKADAAESAQVSRLVTQLALGYPEVGFTLTSAGRRVVQAPPVADVGERFYQLYGDRPDLVDVRRETAGMVLTGFVAQLGEQGPARGPQNVFVNRRIVRDKTIAHAIAAAYSGATIKERSPEVHLFLEVPPDRVDVNVHPTKAEIRFLDQSLVHEVIRRALADALGADSSATRPFQLASPSSERPAQDDQRSALLPGVWSGLTAVSRVEPTSPGTPEALAQGLTSGTSGMIWGGTPSLAGGEKVVGGPGQLDAGVAGEAIRPMVPLGQFRSTYIIAVDAEGLCIIDQHVAHERVLYEQVLERLTSGTLPSQRLLQPILLDLAPAQRDALRGHQADLDRLGFDVGEFGGATVRVSAVPALLGLSEAAAAVRALAEDLEGLERGARVTDALRRLAATTACHAAVKANQPLTHDKMVYILDELRRTAYSSVCPHGRPVVLRMSRREIEKNFLRV
jgi:DNA mismatch repair protein MutL